MFLLYYQQFKSKKGWVTKPNNIYADLYLCILMNCFPYYYLNVAVLVLAAKRTSGSSCILATFSLIANTPSTSTASRRLNALSVNLLTGLRSRTL